MYNSLQTLFHDEKNSRNENKLIENKKKNIRLVTKNAYFIRKINQNSYEMVELKGRIVREKSNFLTYCHIEFNTFRCNLTVHFPV